MLQLGPSAPPPVLELKVIKFPAVPVMVNIPPDVVERSMPSFRLISLAAPTGVLTNETL